MNEQEILNKAVVMTIEQLIEIYDIVFEGVHSGGFKAGEAKNLLFECDYWFIQKPKDNWYENIMDYLDKIVFDKNQLNINQRIIKM